ncbi:MAG: hypothetical protein MR051_06985, partial [Lentisphaeria bacterium]|nr:hypothetical protein [Lentisphaeria bacterium]
VNHGGLVSAAELGAGGLLNVSGGGSAGGVGIVSGGRAEIMSGGTMSDTAVSSGGSMCVSIGGVASDTAVSVGGEMSVFSGGTVNDAVVVSGGSMSLLEGAVVTGDLYIGEGAGISCHAHDLSGAALTVDASGYVTGEVVVATGVIAVGGYGFTGTNNAGLFLKVDSSDNLVLYEREADLAAGTTTRNLTAGSEKYMTGGTVTNLFVGTLATSGNARSVITGGAIAQPVIGGALIGVSGQPTGGHLVTVTLDVRGGDFQGGQENGGMNYVAGYAYGDGVALSVEANYTVDKAVLNLAGASINGNLYAGAHARKYAYASVGETFITVSSGYVEKLYGGGWAERGDKNITGGTAALSTVGTATVTITGGTVERLYAGGGNAPCGYTEVGTANITITGGQVDFVFLGGRNINCSVGSATLTLTGDDALTLTRVSGRNDCGADNTALSTLNVETDVALNYLDDVDRINIAEGGRLTIRELALYDEPVDLAVNLVTDGVEGDWTVLSGESMDVFSAARFYVNGTEYTGGGVVIGDVTYILTKAPDSIKFGKLA